MNKLYPLEWPALTEKACAFLLVLTFDLWTRGMGHREAKIGHNKAKLK